MWTADPTPDNLSYICHNLRAWDRREIFATRWSDSPDDLVTDCMNYGPFSWVMGVQHPIAAIGGVPVWPGVWSMWAFATDEWRQIAASVTKHVRRVMLPKLWAVGAHRLECRAMEGHPSRAWLEWLGAEREATLKGYGKAGETFGVYVLRRP